MKFSLANLLWVFALVASALVAFGGYGLLAAGVVLLFWLAFRSKPGTTTKIAIWLTITAPLWFPLSILPALQASRGPHPQANCMNKLRGVALGVFFYEEEHGDLPPAATRASDGAPLHSWRTLILPFFAQQAIFNTITLNEPWDSAANAAAMKTPLYEYTCPAQIGSAQTHTVYFAVVDEHTLWPPHGSGTLSHVPDGAANTILLLEGVVSCPWAKPQDMTLHEAIDYLASPPTSREHGGHQVDNGYFYLPGHEVHAVTADARLLRIERPINRDLARALLTADGGETIDFGELGRLGARRLDWAHCVGLALFVLLSLAPALRPTYRWLHAEAAHALRGGS